MHYRLTFARAMQLNVYVEANDMLEAEQKANALLAEDKDKKLWTNLELTPPRFLGIQKVDPITLPIKNEKGEHYSLIFDFDPDVPDSKREEFLRLLYEGVAKLKGKLVLYGPAKEGGST
jgi:hypothetical protein